MWIKKRLMELEGGGITETSKQQRLEGQDVIKNWLMTQNFSISRLTFPNVKQNNM